MIRLSICIATLNRGRFIGQTLDSILSQWTEEAELLVVDGASTDDTQSVVAGRFAGRTNCRCIRLEEKGGVDRDYARSVEWAHGEYCWLMTDDDLVLPGALARILAALRSDPDLVVVNAEVANADLSRTIVPRKLPATEDRLFPPAAQDQLLACAGDLLSFIGAVVIRRALWMQRDSQSYFGTEFVHVGVIFQAPLEHDAIVLAQPLIRIRYGNGSWLARSFEIWMFKWPALIWSFGHLPPSAKARVCPREPWRNFRQLLDFKIRGHFEADAYRRWLKDQPMVPIHRLKAWALAVTPGPLFHRLMLLLARLRPFQPATFFELQNSRFARKG